MVMEHLKIILFTSPDPLTSSTPIDKSIKQSINKKYDFAVLSMN